MYDLRLDLTDTLSRNSKTQNRIRLSGKESKPDTYYHYKSAAEEGVFERLLSHLCRVLEKQLERVNFFSAGLPFFMTPLQRRMKKHSLHKLFFTEL